MLIAIEENAERNIQLFANSYSKEFDAKIIIYNNSNIYDTVLIDRPQILMTNNIDNIYYQSILNDIDQQNIHTETKFVILTDSDQTTKSNYKYKNIKHIPNNTYKCYNEYSVPKPSENFILANINCENMEINRPINDILYPNQISMPVKLINCQQYENYHNLGTADETDTLDLISRCEVYINTDNKYLYDAIVMGKKVISLIDSDIVETVTEINEDVVREAKKYSNEYLSKYKISNIVKYIK